MLNTLATLCSSLQKKMDDFFMEKLEAKLTGWKAKSLSWASRSAIKKQVVMVMPKDTASTFYDPTTTMC